MTSALDVLVFYVPVDDTERVLGAVLAAGAGEVGDYRDCAFVAPGTGQFRPVGGARPAIGTVGDLEKVARTGSSSCSTGRCASRSWLPCAQPTPTRSPPST